MMHFSVHFLTITVVLTYLRYTASQNDAGFSKISSANNAFATTIYKVLKEDNKNLVCSPLSLSIVLSMLLEGSPGTSTTFQEIQNVLQYTGLSKTDIEDGYKALFNNLKSNQDYTLNLANSIWIEETFQVLDAYIAKVKDVFQADVESFNKGNGADEINKWVADHTMNKIMNILDELDPNTVVVLVNAIYFQASWADAFLESNNVDDFFSSNDDANSQQKVTFMQQQGSFLYYESAILKAQVLKLNYVGYDVSFVVVLPNEGNTLVELENGLNSKDLEEAISLATERLVEVKLPKFNVSSTLPLNDPLQTLGMNEAFTDQADLSGIAPLIKVSTVLQKAIIEVSENGTVAAAATVVEITTTSVPIGPVVDFTANHPFLFVLYHNPTSSIIFIGRYTTTQP